MNDWTAALGLAVVIGLAFVTWAMRRGRLPRRPADNGRDRLDYIIKRIRSPWRDG